MRIALSDGAQVEFDVRRGAAGSPRLALLHSLGMDRGIWNDVIAALGGGVHVLTIDCRGHGASSLPAGPYALERFADDLAEVFDAISWASAFVAGQSMGGSVALQFAVKYPERVLGLGLADTTAWYGADAKKNWDERAVKAKKEGLRSMVEFQETRWFSDAFRAEQPAAVARARETFLRSGIRQALGAYVETCRMLGNFDLRASLTGIAAPTEVLVGEEDYATPPEMAKRLATSIPGANLEILKGARHLTAIEAPEAVAVMLQRLIARGAAVPGKSG
jgi:3-oxoadipate enol-lactonase